jgi:YfiH family protein
MFFSKKLNKFSSVNHCFFSKKGGISQGIYNSLNCGLSSNDDKKNVQKNLEIVSKKMGLRANSLFTMNQTHSNNVVVINEENKHVQRINSDALVTNLTDVAISVLTADCVPVLIYDEVNQIIASIHAGWKGALGGIIENTLDEIIKLGKNGKINVAIGPCIDVSNYVVGQEFYDTFIQKSKKNINFFFPAEENKFLFNLRKYVNSKFEKLEVNHIENINFDTFSENEKFFSFRKSKQAGHKDYGRCISVISLVND